MNAVVIEHVKVGDLPHAWRVKLPASAATRVTVRIEEEGSVPASTSADAASSDDLLFGMWRDREDMADVDADSSA